MRIINAWLLGIFACIYIVVVSYVVSINQCRGAGCAQAEIKFLWFLVLVLHTKLTLAVFEISKKYWHCEVLLGFSSLHSLLPCP
jgi:hypothetical protein